MNTVVSNAEKSKEIKRFPTLAEHEIIGRILAGSTHAVAGMPWGKPCPIELPGDRDDYERLAGAHLLGFSATVTTAIQNREPFRVRIDPTKLVAYCPRADSRCSWLGCDLDAGGADGHGVAGLAEPLAAARALAGVARDAGLPVLTNRSGSGRGCHVWVFPPVPCSLADGVLAVARLAGVALRTDPAAFATTAGEIAKAGQAGAFELYPKHTDKPLRGWGLAVPFAGANRERGGGHAIDPATGEPCELQDVPTCDPAAWRAFVFGARARLPKPKPRPAPRMHRPGDRDPLGNLDPRAREFLDGRTAEGGRNAACFAASCSLIGKGMPELDAERLIVAGGLACGMREREIRTCFASALGALRAKRGGR